MKNIITIGALVFLVSGTLVFAEDVTNSASKATEPIRTDIREIKDSTKNAIEAAREAAKKENETVKNAFKTEKELILRQLLPGQAPQEAIKILQERRDAFQQQFEANKEALKTIIETKREEAEKAISAKKDELKTALNKFKDERKKQSVEKVSASLNEVNKNAVNRFTNNINELDRAVVNITTRAEKAKVNGKDVTNVMTALQNAQLAIVAARDMVIAQSTKVYSVAVSSEVKVADDLKKSRDLLNTDLKAVQDKIKAAHDSIWVALSELQKIPEVNKTPILPATGTQPVAQ